MELLFELVLATGILASVIGTVVVMVRDGYRPVSVDPRRH